MGYGLWKPSVNKGPAALLREQREKDIKGNACGAAKSVKKKKSYKKLREQREKEVFAG